MTSDPSAGQPRLAGKYAERQRPAGETVLVSLDDRRKAKELDAVLDQLTDMLGRPVEQERRDRLERLATEVTDQDWADGHSIMLNRRTTLWRALLEHTDYDVRSGPRTEITDEGFYPFRPAVHEQVSGWSKLPTAAQVRNALELTAAGPADE